MKWGRRVIHTPGPFLWIYHTAGLEMSLLATAQDMHI